MAASFLRPSAFRAQDELYLRKRFSRHTRLGQLAASWLLDVREMRTMEETILQADDERVMAFKNSQTAAVGMTAVASAIIAQLSSTTLQLPALSSIDWTASALIITALLFSILSTLMSVTLQQTLTTLNEPTGCRMWLSNGSCRRSRQSSVPGLDGQHLQTSAASLILLRLPNFFLLCGVTSFLIGFGLLLGFAWRQDLQTTPSRDSNLSVLVLYAAVGGLAFLGTGGILKWKMGEVHQAETSAGKDLEEGKSDDDGDDLLLTNNEAESASVREREEDVEAGDDAADECDLRPNEGFRKTQPQHRQRPQQPSRFGRPAFSRKEVMHHENIAEALEQAARAHRDLAKLMHDAVHESIGQTD